MRGRKKKDPNPRESLQNIDLGFEVEVQSPSPLWWVDLLGVAMTQCVYWKLKKAPYLTFIFLCVHVPEGTTLLLESK